MFDLHGNTSADILMAIFIVLAIVGAGVFIRSTLLSRVASPNPKRRSKGDRAALYAIIIRSFGIKFYAFLGIFLVLSFFLEVPFVFDRVTQYLFAVFLGAQAILVISRVIDFSVTTYVQSLGRDQRALAAALPSIGFLVKVFLSLFVLVFILANLGVDVMTLLAGLGIGGLAIAFAFQKILSDLFSTFVIFFDRPFSVGDVIEVDGKSGKVERVGIKTTHIRSFSGDLMVVPNGDLVSSPVRNITDQSLRKVVFTLPLSHTTGADVLDSVPAIIEGVVASRDKVQFGHAKAREIDRRAIVFEVSYSLEDASYDEHVSARHSILLDTVSALEKKGVVFGHPPDSEARPDGRA